MHRLIMGLADDDPRQVDHANGDRSDNRRSNLRIATQSQNLGNSRKRAGTTSRYKGVSWHKQNKKWVAYIGVDGSLHHLGCFTSEEAAARAYNRAARAAWGDFACLNDVPPRLVRSGA
jgi:hypothetical protein